MKIRIMLLVMLFVAALTGCGGGGGVNSEPAPAAPSSAATTEPTVDAPTEEVAPTQEDQTAKIGDTVELTGSAEGSSASVVATKVVDPVKATDGFSTPAPGSRYVAVQFRITNTGTAVYEDSPSNGAKVIDSDGQQFDPTFVDKNSAGPPLPSSAKIAAGGRALGFVVFEVPKASVVSRVQFGMDSGMGETGEWVVP